MYRAGSRKETSQFPSLYDMNVEQLQNILQNDATLNDWVKENDEVRSVQLQRETLLATNRSLAEHNLSREPRLKSSKARLASVHMEAAKQRQKFEQDKQQLDAAAAQNSLDTILVMLRSAAGSSEDEAERIADHFLEGDLSSLIFLEQYIAKRKEAHIRRIKAEKMAEIRNKRQTQQHVYQPSAQTYTPYTPGASASTSAPSGAATSTSGSAPYPTGGYTPMPSPFSYS
ncbi:vacuolar protein sorting-associated protein 37B-like [Ptychodera flava]|uniref:vacuolar protein sorting-associated protein 37B-like n=1 Tax=Ptychodera flava TaxID=63121 RepID=UPI00396AA2A0